MFDEGMKAETETRIGQRTAEADLWKSEKQEMVSNNFPDWVGGNSGTTGDGYACPCNLDNLVHSVKPASFTPTQLTEHPFS